MEVPEGNLRERKTEFSIFSFPSRMVKEHKVLRYLDFNFPWFTVPITKGTVSPSLNQITMTWAPGNFNSSRNGILLRHSQVGIVGLTCGGSSTQSKRFPLEK